MTTHDLPGTPQMRSTRPGCVWLVGAGPGDPELITVRGLRCIAEADVIVHDYLANPSLLDHARPDCERICAGKRAGEHSMSQDEINALLAAKARAGKRVCRLKGGDPFLFGRGGEEALYLAQHGVSFEVAPGVSSALAVPAYAGIPVTHRGLAATVHIVTGHEDPSKDGGEVDWDALAGSATGTLVFLMARRTLGQIAERLMRGAWPRSMPAAVIANGALPTQTVITGTLENIAARAADQCGTAPAILVVGKTAALAQTLRWFEKRPLFGKTLVVTRARRQASELAKVLEQLGAAVIQCPTIRTESLAHTPAMRDAVGRLGEMDWVIFTSPNAVEAVFETLTEQEKDARAFAKARIAAIGPATAARLRDFGVRADLTPEAYVAESLLESIHKIGSVAGCRFLLPRSDRARSALSDGLRASGAEVIEVDAYRTIEETCMPDGLLERLGAGRIDMVLFTSSSTVHGFVNAIPETQRAALLPTIPAASIGPITSAALREAGIPVRAIADPFTIPGLVEATLRCLEGRTTGESRP